jgi:SRSO17 transposase
MVLALEGANRNTVRAMQQFLSEGAWDDDTILRRHWQEVDHALGDDNGVLTLAGSDVPKQGTESVGVKRQYCGELGKRANCQAGVFLGYTSPHGYTLLDRRLYLPQAWVEDAGYAERRQACGVPEDVTCTTKPLLGWTMIQAVHHAGRLRCRWVACDEACGRATSVPAWLGRGRQPTRMPVVNKAAAPQAVALIASAVPDRAWSPHSIQEGSTGPMVAECATLRVMAVRAGRPGPEGWLVLRRNGLTGELKTDLSHAPADIPQVTWVRMRGLRWPIATCVEDGKQLLGMGDDEVRSWPGWHHHLTWCVLDHLFLVRLPCRFKKRPRA